jgi:hypothetical protein
MLQEMLLVEGCYAAGGGRGGREGGEGGEGGEEGERKERGEREGMELNQIELNEEAKEGKVKGRVPSDTKCQDYEKEGEKIVGGPC